MTDPETPGEDRPEWLLAEGTKTRETLDSGVDITDGEVAAAAYDAAESVVLSRTESDEVSDLDISVSFDGTLEVDIYIEGPDDAERIAEDAALAAGAATDDLLE